MKKTMSRALSVILAVVMLAVSVPVAFAATQITLDASMVTEWPMAMGELYYGQTVSEGITLTGGKVVYNGEEVPGKFVHFMDTFRPLQASESSKANLKFVPDDETTYKGFNKLMSSTTYVVKKTTPVLKDESDTPVASSVKAGQKLSDSTISGGTMVNPYNATETSIQAAVWQWSSPDTELTESGEYEAYLQGKETCYEKVTKNIYVEVEHDILTTEVKTLPIIESFTYDSETKWKDITLLDGVVVVKGTDTEVEGTFTILDTWLNVVPSAGNYDVEVIFTPSNSEKYMGLNIKVSTTVNPAPLAFVDDEGNVVEDFTFEVEPGVKMYDVKALITTNLRVPQNAVIQVEDNYGFAENGRKYKLTVNHDDSNYEGTELYFTIKFKETEITPALKWVGEGPLKVDCGEYSPPGTFSVYYVVGETETKIGDVKGNSEILEWTPDASGDYGFKVVYNPAENDYFIIKNVTTTPYSHFPEHKLIATGSLATLGFSMGETATVTAPATDPSLLDKPYYGFTGWTDVKGNTGLSDEELANATVTFTMPDEDVELKANYKFSIKLFFEWIWAQIVSFFNFIINAVKDLIALAAA